MNLELQDKVAIVAAASRGLGQAVATRLAQEGARVAICSRSHEAIEQAAAQLRNAGAGEVLARACDVTDAEQVRALVEDVVRHFGRLDIVVTNAGGPPRKLFHDTTPQDWQRAVELNLFSAMHLSLAAIPHLRAAGGGRIVHITSVAAKQPIDQLILSNTARSGVLGFSKTLANEVAPDGILVNCVCPGYTRTQRVVDLAQDLVRKEGIDERDAYKLWERQIPMGRLGEPEEFADVVAFLCSARASYVTGAVIPIDGGYIQGII